MSLEEATFANHAAVVYSLPLTDETNGLICYRDPVPDSSCDALTPALGDLHPDISGLHPTIDQCFKLLKTEWPYVSSQFGEIFPHFHPPDVATITEKNMLKSVLLLWILQYGSADIKLDPLWQGIVTTFNNASLDWSRLLAWSGVLKGFSPNGTTTLAFPKVLETSLTQTSPEMQLFNHFSTLCASACSLGAQCRQISATSVCV
jgi:hypothetical protein